MTDLEITRLCAEAMGWNEKSKRYGMKIDPLRDDAQAMALVNKFGLSIYKEDGLWSAMWAEQYEDGASVAGAEHADLNRAICECVAKTQAKVTA